MGGKKEHWENVYENKGDQEVSWFQENPETSLKWIEDLKLSLEAPLIDIGGGNSKLSEELFKKGYSKISVLDISAKALERTRGKLGLDADKIDWIVSDILDFKPAGKFRLWHDRAVFHFLTEEKDILKYRDKLSSLVEKDGYLLLATFSESGPKKCSGLEITQYSEQKMRDLFEKDFEFFKSMEEVHHTPFDTDQNFIYVLFKKR